jgi:enediyne biosynthesis thioesterase
MPLAYEYRHIVAFEETNLVGNVYYVNALRWQGRCRELFLREHAPEMLEALRGDLVLATTRVTCDYLAELTAFDVVVVRMRLAALTQGRMTLGFEFWRVVGDREELVARGSQEVACLRRVGAEVVAAPVPEALRRALEPYRDTP